MRIGIVIARIGGIDGVALETEKWIAVLRRLGHETTILTGELEGEIEDATVLPELALGHAATLAAQESAFIDRTTPPGSEAELLSRLDAQARQLERQLLRWTESEGIECVLSENASALPCHLALGMALRRLFEETGLPAVTHDHDFPWERGDRYESPYPGIREIVARCFPVKLPNVRHAVINSAARDTLARRFGIDDAVVVPNVMDFDAPIGERDEFNADLRVQLGLEPDDILLCQVTRIVRRKGIEIAIDLVHRLADPRVKLVITGTALDDRFDTYADELRAQVARLGLERQVLFAGDRFDTNRRVDAAGRKTYSLWDAYAQADACTYFSLYEGFGNAFVEAVVARRPIFVNDYEPVYWPDIGSQGVDTVMIRDGRLTAEAVEQVRRVLNDEALRTAMTERNFQLGRRHFSYQALAELLTDLFA